MTNEQMRVELPELPRPDKIEQDMDVNLGRVEYRYFCEDATTAYATAAILADRERRAAKDAGDGDVVVTWDEGRTRIVAVTRQDDEGRVIEVIAEAPPAPAEPVSVAVREQLFKMTNAYAKAMKDAGVSYYPEALVIVREARAVIAAAQPTLRTATEELLFADMKTDEQKADFFLSGRAYETGVIAKAIQNDVSMAYRRCAEYAKALAATQQAENEALRKERDEMLLLLADPPSSRSK